MPDFEKPLGAPLDDRLIIEEPEKLSSDDAGFSKVAEDKSGKVKEGSIKDYFVRGHRALPW